MNIQDHWHLYPDIDVAGGLGRALNVELTRLNVDLPVQAFGGGSWARAVSGSRSADLVLTLAERMIYCNLGADGVGMGRLMTPELAVVADAVRAWLIDVLSVADMETRFPTYNAGDAAKEFEAGLGVNFAWKKLGERLSRHQSRLVPLLDAAAREPGLRQLMPFTSHESLCFSRCLGYPYTTDCPHAIPIGEGRYRALGPGYVMVDRTFTDKQGKNYDYKEPIYDILGDGDAEHVIGLIVVALPPGCGPAVRGTSDDLERTEQDLEVVFLGEEV